MFKNAKSSTEQSFLFSFTLVQSRIGSGKRYYYQSSIRQSETREVVLKKTTSKSASSK